MSFSTIRIRSVLLVSDVLKLASIIFVIILPCHQYSCHGFSTRAVTTTPTATTRSIPSSSSTKRSSSISSNNNDNDNDNNNNILILDHININHEKGRHDWLKSFYGEDFLGCVWDPRKASNLESGRKTLWANIGANQFHLSEGSPNAQVLEGCVTIVHPSLELLKERYKSMMTTTTTIMKDSCCLRESKFDMVVVDGNNKKEDKDKQAALIVTDPWGSIFRIVEENNGCSSSSERDSRGSQPGDTSEGLAIRDLTIHVPIDANLDGIGRFYRDVLGGESVVVVDDDVDDHKETEKTKMLRIRMGPLQTLTFVPKESIEVNTHVDLREIKEEQDDADDDDDEKSVMKSSSGTSTNLGNYGVHISLYVADLPSCYQRAHDLGLTYVNKRFSRRAYTLEEAADDCMFRCLDIVDPLNIDDGPILRLEHEVRSVIKRDKSKYKSCPFDEIPNGCVTL